MFSRISSCFRRHKKKLLFIGGVIGGLTFLNTYMKRKFVEWESKRAREYIEQMKRASHFEGTISTCDSALLSFAPQIRGQVSTVIDVNAVVERLQENPENKLELWERLKILVFTQAVGEMYAQCLLAALLRVQMSILGGYIYAKLHRENRQPDADATKKQQKYLSRITSFLIDGVNDLLIPVEKAVWEVLEPIPLDQIIKLSDFEEFLERIKLKISQGSEIIPNITQYLISSDSKDANQNEDNTCDEFMENILRETKDVLECKDFTQVLSLSIEHGTATLMDRISECFVFMSNDNSQFMNPHNFSTPFAKIIPMIYKVFSQHGPSEQGGLTHVLLQQESLKTFAANIYEAFSQHSDV